MQATSSVKKFIHSPTLRATLERVSLYLVAYETLKSCIVDRVKGFFTDEWTITEDGNLDGKISTEYRGRVLTLNPRDELTACGLFLRDIGCLGDEHLSTVSRLRSHRNDLAHRIVSYITNPSCEVSREHIVEACTIVKHIDVWWLREVELATDPDWTPEKVAEIEWDQVTGGYSVLLQLILPMFDGDSTLLDQLHNDLERQFPLEEGAVPS